MNVESLPERKVPIIAIEGVDACGKGTQSYRLSKMLTEKHLLSSIVTPVLSDDLGQISYLRKFLVGGQPVSRISELLVYLASIYEVCSDIQKEEVDLAIMDRSIFSTIAYQTVGRESIKEPFGVDRLFTAIYGHEQFSHVVVPDYVIVIDVDYDVQIARMEHRGKLDHFERMPRDFHERVRGYYLQLEKSLQTNPRVAAKTVSGVGDVDEITENIYTALRAIIRPKHQHFFK